MEFGARQWADHCEKQAARIAQLEASLRELSSAIDYDEYDTSNSLDRLHNATTQARAALAASPDAAGRRWEAMREVCEAARAKREFVEATDGNWTADNTERNEALTDALWAAIDALARAEALLAEADASCNNSVEAPPSSGRMGGHADSLSRRAACPPRHRAAPASEPVDERCGKHGSHQDGCGACDRVRLTALLAERDAAQAERDAAKAERDEAQTHMLVFLEQRDAAQAALAQAQAIIEVWQREAQSAREEADSINAKALRWAAERLRDACAAARREVAQGGWATIGMFELLANTIEAGPQPAERGEDA